MRYLQLNLECSCVLCSYTAVDIYCAVALLAAGHHQKGHLKSIGPYSCSSPIHRLLVWYASVTSLSLTVSFSVVEQSVTTIWLLPNYAAWHQRRMSGQLVQGRCKETEWLQPVTCSSQRRFCDYHAAWVMAENLPMKSPARAITKHFPLENCGRPYRTWRKTVKQICRM